MCTSLRLSKLYSVVTITVVIIKELVWTKIEVQVLYFNFLKETGSPSLVLYTTVMIIYLSPRILSSIFPSPRKHSFKVSSTRSLLLEVFLARSCGSGTSFYNSICYFRITLNSFSSISSTLTTCSGGILNSKLFKHIQFSLKIIFHDVGIQRLFES